jgi:nucleoid DNA-binding protein
VLSVAKTAQEEQKAIALLVDIENYLINTPKEDLTPEKIQLNFRPILEDPDADYEQLNIRLAQFDRPVFERTLARRQDLSPTEAAAIIDELEMARERVLQEALEQQAAIKVKAEQQWLKVQSYLRDTGKEELNPQAIERELKLLLHDPQAGAAVLRERLSHFDRDTLVQLLAQRQDISQEQAAQIVDRVERIWTRIRYAPQQLTGKAKEQYEKTTSAIENYLRSTGKEELNPEGIKRDLTRLLEDPKAGAKAIRHRLAMMDRDTLVKLLSQREDLSEEQVNQIIDQVQENLRSFARAPRRLARRTQRQVREFRDAIADYLRSTDREELNPEGIQRDIQLLLHDRRAGVESLKDRLAHFDRDTLVALLSQRGDISEEEVNRIIDQIFLVRDQFLIQLQSIQNRIQSIIDGIFLKIRDYLNSLERPELNYEGIKGDLRTLFDDPQAGFEALRDRFSQIDRNTLVAILSSRPDISKEDAQRIIGQIEGTRDRILQKAERLQQQAQLRLEQVKQETQRQMEETRKAAATAAWWLFFTALISAAAAAGGGVVGVIGVV